MFNPEQLFVNYDMYDDFDCVDEEGANLDKDEENKTIKVKKEKSETDYDVLESGDQLAGTGERPFFTFHFY